MTLAQLRKHNPTFFSRAANRFHGTTKVKKVGSVITCYNSYLDRDGNRTTYVAHYYAVGTDLIPIVSSGDQYVVYLRRDSSLVACPVDLTTGRLVN